MLKSVKPSGPSHFREAYAYGMGMMLDYNSQYIHFSDVLAKNFYKPEYLHLVIGSEEEAPNISQVTEQKIKLMHYQVMNKMKTEIGRKILNE